jgi:hypothetical protein
MIHIFHNYKPIKALHGERMVLMLNGETHPSSITNVIYKCSDCGKIKTKTYRTLLTLDDLTNK